MMQLNVSLFEMWNSIDIMYLCMEIGSKKILVRNMKLDKNWRKKNPWNWNKNENRDTYGLGTRNIASYNF